MADEFDDIEFDIDLAQVAEIERRHASTSNLRQLDLRGNPVSAPAASTLRSVSAPSTTSAHGQNTFAKVRAVKRWDPKAFAKFGWSKRVAAASKRKRGKRKASDDWDGDEDEDEDLDPVDDDGEDDVVYDNDPAAAYSPPSFKPDSIAMCTFVYPILPSKPRRDYQYNIVRSALLNNTLVSLPTGLGKTFIAACVMYVLFAAAASSSSCSQHLQAQLLPLVPKVARRLHGPDTASRRTTDHRLPRDCRHQPSRLRRAHRSHAGQHARARLAD